MRKPVPWETDQGARNRLRKLWLQRDPILSSNAIAERMHSTAHAVEAAARHMNLPPRPALPKPAPRPKVAEKPAHATPRPTVAAPSVAQPQPRRVYVAAPDKGYCCWPIGEPGARGFRYCHAETKGHRLYCPDHVATAYDKVEPR